MVSQLSCFTRRGTDRILEYAFELARKRQRKHVTSATKSNGIVHTMPYWDERFAAMAGRYPDVKTAQFHIDILTAHFVQHPDRSEEHTSELQSLMRISYAVFCLKKKKHTK